ncbi:GNAT family N-acetyltransferase [Flavobacterium amniphilum]|uniref:GNAT family N-acetyltransferase n=1 Tax=Flavobacterium amniphilum TaxID=1834035 RepID=UPI00202A2CD4|nr:GNAT family N-acetyltransferase [Flavobacterium amniphilum]MCL9805704.1 GNAT family N-acetyltransferase [Flavobacterium amniphilum]
MTKELANQIVELINRRNGLSVKYNFEKIFENKDNYVFILDTENLVACAESKKVQWYQWEICHISVDEKYEGKGYGSKILKLAEAKAKNENARILQSTIRSNNESSIRLFEHNSYKKVNEFHNPKTQNQIYVYQKSLNSKIE